MTTFVDDQRLLNAAPVRSVEQRMEALDRANHIRGSRAQLKRDVRAGRSRASDHLRDPGEWLEMMHVRDLLLAVPKLGRVKVNRVMARFRIAPGKTVGGLSPRQREDLLAFLAGR
jgi:hypothetical protein